MRSDPAARRNQLPLFSRRSLALAAIALALLAPSSRAQETTRHLLMIGGADRSPVAMQRFVSWAGGSNARILVVPYASTVPDEYAGQVAAELSKLSPAGIETAVSTDTLETRGASAFFDQLSRNTAVFFTGGDQTRLMGILKRYGLVETLRARYRAGMPFAGTSAGTAVMSDPMITGDGNFDVIDGAQVATAEGLGLLQGPYLVDQHFIKRSRENRLFGLVLKDHALLGIGIDESSALAVDDERDAEVLDAGDVMIVRAPNPGEEALSIEILRSGQKYDLKDRRRLE